LIRQTGRRVKKNGKAKSEQVYKAAKGTRTHTKGERENGQTAATKERQYYHREGNSE
jgi:hypothetical protein